MRKKNSITMLEGIKSVKIEYTINVLKVTNLRDDLVSKKKAQGDLLHVIWKRNNLV